MVKFSIIAVLVFLSATAHSQQDFFILKKKDITLQSFTDSSYINCELTNGQWVEGYIKVIRSDSVFITPFHINYLPTIWGTYIPDTTKDEVVRLKLKDIYAIPRKKHSFEYIKNGSIFEIAGAGYVLLNVINGLSSKETIFGSSNIGKLGAGAGLFLFGKILHWSYPADLVIKKKYTLQYISMSASSQ